MHVGLSKNTATRETQNGIEGIVSINKMLFQPTSGLMESRKRGSLPLYTKGAGGQQLAALIFHFVLLLFIFNTSAFIARRSFSLP